MNISEGFIKRPIATSLLMAAIALFGVVAYRSLPVADLPTVDSPTIQIQAGLPGGDPSSMASAVASPIERQLTTIAGIDSRPAIIENWFSSGVATEAPIVSGLAPGSCAVTSSVGKSTFGRSLTGSC